MDWFDLSESSIRLNAGCVEIVLDDHQAKDVLNVLRGRKARSNVSYDSCDEIGMLQLGNITVILKKSKVGKFADDLAELLAGKAEQSHLRVVEGAE